MYSDTKTTKPKTQIIKKKCKKGIWERQAKRLREEPSMEEPVKKKHKICNNNQQNTDNHKANQFKNMHQNKITTMSQTTVSTNATEDAGFCGFGADLNDYDYQYLGIFMF